MAPYTRPEAVLKQAEGLIQVGQSTTALQSLTEVFSTKRFRSTALSSLEPIMIRIVELCVEMRRGRTAKESLMQYKNIAQNSSVPSIEIVIKRLISHADAKVIEAQEKAERAIAVDVDDLEASETPEDVLLGAVSGDQNKDRTDRALVTPWLKFSWESYRTALETLKNNARLEAIYQQIALQAFKFCLKHTRKVEFRRLCETLRLHLSNVAKYSHQTHSINLSDPETLQRHLDTRFAQLNASVELELWQEAFRSVEDIHNLLTLAKKAPRPAMMANYYEKLSRIFLTSGNALYHAAAWSRYYSVVRNIGGKSDEELAQLAGLVLISALAVPVSVPDSEEDESKTKSSRLTALLGLSKSPSRASLLREALFRNTLSVSRPEVQALYQLLEVDVHPSTICANVAPIFQTLSKDATYAPYLPLLNRVLLSRLFGELSQVYSSVRLSNVVAIVEPLNEPYDTTYVPHEVWDITKLESFLMRASRRGELLVQIDHAKASISFASSGYGVASTSTVASSEDLIRSRFSRLTSALSTSLVLLYPPQAPSIADQFATLVKAADDERERLAIRRSLATRRVELLTELTIRKEKEEQSVKAEQVRREKEAEAKRAAELSRKREQDRIKREIDEKNREEARALAETLMNKSGIKVPVKDIEKYDTSQLISLQVQQLDREKRELNERLRVLHKHIDHFERAVRKEERPLLAVDYNKQQREDKETHERNAASTLALSQQKHQEDIGAKKRLLRIMDDYGAYRGELMSKREELFKEKRAKAFEAMEKEKDARRVEIQAEREANRKEWEAAEARRREEEEKERAEQRAREEEVERQRAAEAAKAAEAEAAQKAAEEKAAETKRTREAERAKVLEEVRLKQQREEEAERRQQERKKPTALGPTGPPRLANGESPAPGGGWRARAAASGAAGNTTPPSATPHPPASGGTYKPPGARDSGFSPRSGSATPTTTTPSRPSPFGSARPRDEPTRPQSPFGGAKPREQPVRPATPQKDADGFQPSAQKWRPRLRGAGEAPPR